MDGFPVNSQSPVHVPLSLSPSWLSALLLRRRRLLANHPTRSMSFLFSPSPKPIAGQNTAHGAAHDVQAVKEAVVSLKGSTRRKTLFLPRKTKKTCNDPTLFRVLPGAKKHSCAAAWILVNQVYLLLNFTL